MAQKVPRPPLSTTPYRDECSAAVGLGGGGWPERETREKDRKDTELYHCVSDNYSF